MEVVALSLVALIIIITYRIKYILPHTWHIAAAKPSLIRDAEMGCMEE